MSKPLREARVIMECTRCQTRSIWRTNNRVIYPNHTLNCKFCGPTFHKRIKVGKWMPV